MPCGSFLLAGTIHEVHPLQGELISVLKTAQKKVHDVEDLNTVSWTSRLRFEAMVGNRGTGVTCDLGRDGRGDRGGVLTDLPQDQGGLVFEPMSCSDFGWRKCGDWDDGCGGTVICGICDPGRTGLPSTWRIKSPKCRCVDYCPPWDERGLWFLSDDLLSEMNRIGEVIGMSEDVQRFLSPVDAVDWFSFCVVHYVLKPVQIIWLCRFDLVPPYKVIRVVYHPNSGHLAGIGKLPALAG
jgi:hypothetical protein